MSFYHSVLLSFCLDELNGRRNPDKVSRRVSSVNARLNMQRTADIAINDQAKSINHNWRGVKKGGGGP